MGQEGSEAPPKVREPPENSSLFSRIGTYLPLYEILYYNFRSRLVEFDVEGE